MIRTALHSGAFLLLLAGCGDTFDQTYAKPPQLAMVTVTVRWVEAADIAKVCGNEKAYACATVGTLTQPSSFIYAMRPRSFSDSVRVEALGHEMLHALGATH